MTEGQLQGIQDFFTSYCGRFAAHSDAEVQANLQLKEAHTERVVEQARRIAGWLQLSPASRRLAEAAALLHDIARFPQFVQFGTFQDSRSRDHGRWGREILEEEGILREISPGKEEDIILQAVENHNRQFLPGGLSSEADTQCRVLRDADKIDIIHVVTSQRLTPRGLTEDPGGSREEVFDGRLVQAVLSNRSADNRLVQTAADMHILQLTWLYDLNYPVTWKILQERGLIEALLGRLPEDSPGGKQVMKEVRSHVRAYAAQMTGQPADGLTG